MNQERKRERDVIENSYIEWNGITAIKVIQSKNYFENV